MKPRHVMGGVAAKSKQLPHPANDNLAVWKIPTNGGCSTTSGMADITLRRLACLDGVGA